METNDSSFQQKKTLERESIATVQSECKDKGTLSTIPLGDISSINIPMKAEQEHDVKHSEPPAMTNILAMAAAESFQMKSNQSPFHSACNSSMFAATKSTTAATGLTSMAQHSISQTANFMFAPQQFTTNASNQPQFFIAGPSPTAAAGMPFQQILIPVNQQQVNNGSTGTSTQVPHQYITIPVSLGVGAPQPIQILANPPIITATGIQPFTMIPSQPVAAVTPTPDQVTSGNKVTENPVATTQGAIVPPIIISAGGHTILSTPQIHQPTLQQHQSQLQTHSMLQDSSNPNDLTSQIAKFLPSIQSLTSSLGQRSSVTDAGGNINERTSNSESHSPGANETLVSSTEPGSIVDGIVLDDIKEFARQFKCRRLSMGLTQTQVGQALSAAEGPAYSQSAICRFEKLDITPKSAQKIKPVLERWLVEAEAKHRSGGNSLNEAAAVERSKKRKRRTSFTPQSVELLSEYFMKNTHPSGTEMTAIANKLGYDREVVRVWFCNKRQALKNATKRLKPDTSTTEHSSL